MTPEAEWRQDVVAMIPALRAFAWSISRNGSDADDLVQETLILVGAAGLSYEEAAEICGCALGTIKSRVNRARTRLLKLMEADEAAEVLVSSAPRAAGAMKM